MPPSLAPAAAPAYHGYLYYGYAGLTLTALAVALTTGAYYLMGLPILLWVIAQAFLDFRPLFYLLLLTLPLSTNLVLPGGVGTDLPTEPLAVGLTGLFTLHAARHWGEYTARRFLHPVALLLYLHVGWILFTTLYSETLTVSLKFSAAKLWYVGGYFFVPLLVLRTPRQLRIVVHCIFWPLLFVAVQTLLRHATYGFSFADQFRTMYPFMPEHVSYAACLTMFFPWVVYLRWYRGHEGRSRWWLTYLVIPLWLIAIFFTFTRAAFVALVLAGGALLLIKWRLLRPALIVAVAAAVIGVAYMIDDNRYLELAPNYDTTISHDEFGNLISATYKLEDISTMERLYRWVAGGHMVPYQPLTGWGPGTFLEHYKGFTVPNFETYVSDNEGRSGIHSYYLMTLVEQGFPGLAVFLCYVLGVLFIGQDMYHRARGPVVRNAILAAVLALLVVDAFNIINDQLETDKVGGQYLLNLAILIAMGVYRPGERGPSGTGAPSGGDTPPARYSATHR